MIAAAVPPRRCHHCGTTWATCGDRCEYQGLACCTSHDHYDQPRTCTGCGADEFACARKAALGGRACCVRCTHVQIRKAEAQ